MHTCITLLSYIHTGYVFCWCKQEAEDSEEKTNGKKLL